MPPLPLPLPQMMMRSTPQMLLLLLIIGIEAAAASLSSSSSSASSGGKSNIHLQREERRRYANLPPTVFAPGGRLHGVERVAREAMLLDDDDGDDMEGRGGRSAADDDIDGDGIDEEDVSSCATFAICCRRRHYYNLSGESNGGEAEDEFAVMVGVGPMSPYLHREYEQDDDDEGFYQSLTINDDDDQYDSGMSLSLSPLSVLSPHLIIGTGGKSIDSTILLRRTIEMAVDTYANEDGGVGWFISHSLEGTNNGQRMEEDLWTPKGGVASIDVSSLVRRVADMAQISTQSLGGRCGRMLSSSLLAVGSRKAADNLAVDDEFCNDERGSYQLVNHPGKDTLILWRVDPTGQFWRLDASAIGRGCSEVEKEFIRRVKVWKRNRNGRTNGESTDNHDMPELKDEMESSFIVHNIDVRSYLGSLSVHDAVQLTTDCLVHGIMNRRSSVRRRSRRNPISDSKEAERRNKLYERGLRRRVQAVIVRSEANSNHHTYVGRLRRPFIEIVV